MISEKYYPYSVNIEITLACNMRCLHCGATAGKARKDELTIDEFKKLFKDLKSLSCQEVCLLGGEPFLRKDWYEIAKIATDYGLSVIFITNGYIVNKKIVEKLKKIGKIDRIGVSIDGGEAKIHDKIRGREKGFEKAWEAALKLRDAGFETGVITTVSKLNFSSLEKLKEKIYKENLTWQIQMASPQGERFDKEFVLSLKEFYQLGLMISNWRREIPIEDLPVCGSHDIGYFSSYFSNYSELPNWQGCAAGLYTLGILSNGQVKGCLSQHDNFIEDSIRKRSIIDIWNDENLFLRNRKFNPNLLEGYCKNCNYGEICKGGCSNLSYTITGSLYNNPYCFHSIEQRGII